MADYIFEEQQRADSDPTHNDSIFVMALERQKAFAQARGLSTEQAQENFVGMFVAATDLVVRILQRQEGDNHKALKPRVLRLPFRFAELPESVSVHLRDRYDGWPQA